MNTISHEVDNVTRLIRHCHQDRTEAERLFQKLITEKGMSVEIPYGHIVLTPDEHDEFVERYSSEVEPTLWESKRLKN